MEEAWIESSTRENDQDFFQFLKSIKLIQIINLS